MRFTDIVHIIVAFFACFTGSLATTAAAADPFAAVREKMVDDEIVSAGVKNPRVIASMRATPRHEFVAAGERARAYYDMALPIGNSQTISPPYVVAYMTEQLDPQPTDNVLEIGTGSGFQAAVLSPLVKDVYTIEIVKPLGERAARTLKRLKYTNVHPKIGDGFAGWPEHAPFEKIIVTCSPEKVPTALVEQLAEGGRLIVPVGERYQQTLYLFRKVDGKLTPTALLPTLFVPMTGTAEAGREKKPDPAHPRIANGGFEELAQAPPAKSPERAVEKAAEKAADTPPAGTAPTKPAGEEPSPIVGPAQRAPVPSGPAPAAPNPAVPAAAPAAPRPLGWHYQRQLEVVESVNAPQGKHYARFVNIEPGRASRGLQGMAVDGREVADLDFSLWVRVDRAQPGRGEEEVPLLGIVFYDENRSILGGDFIGPWLGSFAWRHEQARVRVPPQAREAVIRIGMHGGVGELDLDDIEVQAVPRR